MTEHEETSYYEIALTNRQVMVAFVLLLGAVLVAFLSGVWLGRGELELPAGDRQIAALPNEPEGPELKELQFFSEGAPAAGAGSGEPERLAKPDLSSLRSAEPAEKERGPTTLAQDVGSPGADRAAPPPPARRSPPPPAARQSPPKKEARPAPAVEPSEGFIVQVFSTRDEPQAKKVLERLAAGGYPAYLSPVEVNRQTMYRVRVGPYDDRARADRVGSEVKRKFRYDTWITAASN